MKFRFAVIVVSFFVSGISAQNYPYPQNVTYKYGFMPTTLSTENFEKWYNSFMKGNFLQSCNGGIAPQTDQGSKVEAMGWATILAAYMGDKETFDGLYKFYQSKIQSHGMMAWLTSCGGVSDAGSASDGDLDVAFALCVAAWQWGESYKEEAIKVINTVEKLITQCGSDDVSTLYPGFGSHGSSPYGGCNETDISYYTPAFFRVFAEFTGNDAWEKLADDTYIILNNGANDQTGLVPDWQTWQGGRTSRNYSYGYDACRVPWRMTLDYLWNGNEEAKKWCTTIAEWANKKGPGNIRGNYNIDGSGGNAWPAMSFVGGFAVATMVHSQEAVDAFGKHVAGMSFDTQWYHAYLGNMYMLALTGNMWRPVDSVSSGSPRPISSVKKAQKHSLSVQNIANRELVLSGIGTGYSLSLATLDGRTVCRTRQVNESSIRLDISSVNKGCYVLSVRNRAGAVQNGRIVTIY